VCPLPSDCPQVGLEEMAALKGDPAYATTSTALARTRISPTLIRWTMTAALLCCSRQPSPGGTPLGIGRMAEGTIKRLTDKGFGFIDTGSGKDIFFHSSDLEGVSYEELQEGQRVSYTEGRGPKGPRAENVKPV